MTLETSRELNKSILTIGSEFEALFRKGVDERFSSISETLDKKLAHISKSLNNKFESYSTFMQQQL